MKTYKIMYYLPHSKRKVYLGCIETKDDTESVRLAMLNAQILTDTTPYRVRKDIDNSYYFEKRKSNRIVFKLTLDTSKKGYENEDR